MVVCWERDVLDALAVEVRFAADQVALVVGLDAVHSVSEGLVLRNSTVKRVAQRLGQLVVGTFLVNSEEEKLVANNGHMSQGDYVTMEGVANRGCRRILRRFGNGIGLHLALDTGDTLAVNRDGIAHILGCEMCGIIAVVESLQIRGDLGVHRGLLLHQHVSALQM